MFNEDDLIKLDHIINVERMGKQLQWYNVNENILVEVTGQVNDETSIPVTIKVAF